MVNPADPTGRTLKGKDQLKWVYGDTLVTTVDRRQVVLAIESYGTATDKGTLDLSLGAARGNLDAAGIGKLMRLHLADAGFASRAVLGASREGISLIAVSRTNAGDWKPPSDAPEYQRMAARLRNPAGAKLYKRRMGMIEPVFRQMTQHGGRDLHFRGPGRAVEILVIGTAHNIGKLTGHCRALGVRPGRVEEPLKTLTVRKWKSPHSGVLTQQNHDP
jgi:hypothetical protein